VKNNHGTTIGTITLFFLCSRKAIPEHALETVKVFTQLISAGVEHNQLNRETRRIELIAERQSIANEIHDSLAQTLMYARMRANLLIESIRVCNELMAAQYAHDLDETLESCQKTVRTLITDFRCEIDPAGLLQALNVLTQQFTERHGIALEYINRVADLDLSLEYEIQIFHIVREALANIATHSNATHARLIIDSTSNDYLFTIEDNGRGGYTFTPIEGHYGMLIMRERAARIGGDIKIESSEGLGTLVQLFLPNSAIRGESE
jgi:two-component system nitrate/nitrite sensor histidine kinase NarX